MMSIYCFPTANVIEKWYRKLKFPTKYDDEFYMALQTIEIPSDTTIETYNQKESDGKKNLLAFLYMCERLEQRYSEKGIPDEILLDTLGDLVRWTDTWTDLKGELYLGQLTWVSIPMKMEIFKLGRLQFCMQKNNCEVPRYGLSNGEDIIGIHIPAGEPLTQEAAINSIEMAKVFFATYYPDYRYKFFTCHSWLLDTSLSKFLPAKSNILRFQQLFDIVAEDRSDAIIRYVFRWEANREDLEHLQPTSNFSERIREHILSGGNFYESLGVIPLRK